MASFRRLIAVSFVPPLAKEMAAQIDAGVGNRARLCELGMPSRVAAEFVTQITSGGNARRLMELGVPGRAAREIASQITP